MKRQLYLLIFTCFPLFSFGQDSLQVIASSGLNFRKAPALDARKKGGAPFGVWVFRRPGKAVPDTVNSIPGNWIPVEWKDQRGFAFDAYLSSQGLVSSQEARWRILYPGIMGTDSVYPTESMNWYGFYPDRNGDHCEIRRTRPEFHIVRHNGKEYCVVGIDSAKAPNLWVATRDTLPEGKSNGWSKDDYRRLVYRPADPARHLSIKDGRNFDFVLQPGGRVTMHFAGELREYDGAPGWWTESTGDHYVFADLWYDLNGDQIRDYVLTFDDGSTTERILFLSWPGREFTMRRVAGQYFEGGGQR